MRLFHYSVSYNKVRWTLIPLVTILAAIIVLLFPFSVFSSDIEKFSSLKKEIGELIKGLKKYPDDWDLNYKIGMACENVGDYLNAQQVYSLGPLILKGQLSLDKTFDFEMFSKNNESANRVLAKSVNVYSAIEEMIDYQNNGNFQKAIDIGHEAIKSNPHYEILLSVWVVHIWIQETILLHIIILKKH